MADRTNNCTVSEFQRNASQYLRRLRRSRKPQVLTINGKPEFIVQDAASYQRLLEAADLSDAVKTLRGRISSPTDTDVPAAKVLQRVREVLRLKASR